MGTINKIFKPYLVSSLEKNYTTSRPTLLHGAEVWTIREKDERRLILTVLYAFGQYNKRTKKQNSNFLQH